MWSYASQSLTVKILLISFVLCNGQPPNSHYRYNARVFARVTPIHDEHVNKLQQEGAERIISDTIDTPCNQKMNINLWATQQDLGELCRKFVYHQHPADHQPLSQSRAMRYDDPPFQEYDNNPHEANARIHQCHQENEHLRRELEEMRHHDTSHRHSSDRGEDSSGDSEERGENHRLQQEIDELRDELDRAKRSHEQNMQHNHPRDDNERKVSFRDSAEMIDPSRDDGEKELENHDSPEHFGHDSRREDSSDDLSGSKDSAGHSRKEAQSDDDSNEGSFRDSKKENRGSDSAKYARLSQSTDSGDHLLQQSRDSRDGEYDPITDQQVSSYGERIKEQLLNCKEHLQEDPIDLPNAKKAIGNAIQELSIWKDDISKKLKQEEMLKEILVQIDGCKENLETFREIIKRGEPTSSEIFVIDHIIERLEEINRELKVLNGRERNQDSDDDNL